MKFLFNKDAMKFIAGVEKIFKGWPHLPAGLVKFIVKITPWLVGLGGVFSVLAGLSLLVAGPFSPGMMYPYMSFRGNYHLFFYLIGFFQLALGFLFLKAFNPLRARKMEGWIYLFWAEVLSAASNIASFFSGGTSFFGLIFGLVLGFYVLFEIKSSYKGK